MSLGWVLTCSAVMAPVTAAAVCVTDPVVTSTEDSGAGALRQAIADACDGSTVTFDLPGTGAHIITLTTGELLINKSLVIEGPGTGLLTVQRSAAAGTPEFRIVHIAAGPYDVVVKRVTLSGGSSGDDLAFGGGGLLNQSSGTVDILESAIRGSVARGLGGGIQNAPGAGVLNVTTSSITGNTVNANPVTEEAGFGGGIANQGQLNVTTSTISGNTVNGTIFLNGGGSGVFNLGQLTITDTIIRSNTGTRTPGALGGGGAGVFNAGTGTLTTSTVTENVYDNLGGGIYNAATFTIERSTIHGNTGAAGGGLYGAQGTLFVKKSTISGNSAHGGGGIGIDSGTVIVENSTISGNFASAAGGGVDTSISQSTSIVNSTITNNTAGSGGGGIFGAVATLGNSIVANNTASFSRDIHANLIMSLDYNLIGQAPSGETFTGYFIAGATAHNIHEVDPKLGPLADNGGPTRTHALLSGSPAIDKGKNFTTEATDQRGSPRPVDLAASPNAGGGDGSDIGALELGKLPGDLDGDGDVDRDDVAILLVDRNKTVKASACGAQCDLDGDGMITTLDARQLTLQCTRPGCARQ